MAPKNSKVSKATSPKKTSATKKAAPPPPPTADPKTADPVKHSIYKRHLTTPLQRMTRTAENANPGEETHERDDIDADYDREMSAWVAAQNDKFVRRHGARAGERLLADRYRMMMGLHRARKTMQQTLKLVGALGQTCEAVARFVDEAAETSAECQ